MFRDFSSIESIHEIPFRALDFEKCKLGQAEGFPSLVLLVGLYRTIRGREQSVIFSEDVVHHKFKKSRDLKTFRLPFTMVDSLLSC